MGRRISARIVVGLALLAGFPVALAGYPNGIDFWWTALGDSYASGVGAGKYTGGKRCLRYDSAYPVKMQGNNQLGHGETPEEKRLFQNTVCSGAEVEDIEKWQLLDEDSSGPWPQYGDRPKFGEPDVATLTVGGDDIDFPGILFNCIIESHIWGGPKFRECDDQKKHSWGLIKDPALVTSISGLIGKIVEKGRAGQAKDKFQLYVTGYGQFFNAKTTECNDVTFARTANPKDDGKDHIKMTQELRDEYNRMSLGLNDAIKKAVDEHKDDNVKYIDIDAALEGHRFCEEGIKEPDQQNDKLWLFHYPYHEDDNAATIGGDQYQKVIDDANSKVFGDLSIAALSAKYDSGKAVNDAWFDAIDVANLPGGVDAAGFWDGTVGYRAKLFHPQVPWHQWIEEAIIKQWQSDRDIDSTGASSTAPGGPAPTPPPDRWSYTFHSYTGNLAKGDFSYFVLPGNKEGKYGNSKRFINTPDDQPSPRNMRRGERLEATPTRDDIEKRSADGEENSLEKRDPIGGFLPPIPPPLPTHSGEVWVWTQKDSGATAKGPLKLDCTVPQDQWQGFPPGDTGLKWDLMIQSGHACAFNPSDYGNLDNLHVKYADGYQDIPDGINDKKCITHDNGVSCNNFQVA